ncbi:threonylcarbamoyl-AMP synthase [Peribacillus saganii]|uniref:Threonylcarbamoyl-AMP synthase n=1 Tax=Peribacillus saganii TaxID=2303992 RepID=A0A372LRY4_9BACI|nr:L-threonylcarbamoyladenylate synthase [Peribacillus saganii]RFU70836.1 threonylcarbamoyl-AMP synthase [Peribacillus saganii]
MKTIKWIVDKDVDNLKTYPQITEPAELLKTNELVAFPTETVYGLGANAKSDEAVEKIFLAKGRPSDNPLIVHIASKEQLQQIAEEIPAKAESLIDAFWPGPLTVVLKKKAGVLSEKVTAGLETVAVRMPDDPVALSLIAAADIPIAAPSANTSGRPSPTAARHVLDDLEGKIAGIVDGGSTGVGLESTVVDCTEAVPAILRPGGVTKEEIESVIGPVKVDEALKNAAAAPKSPGMKYTHYAPKADFFLVKGEPSFIQQLIEENKAKGLRTGVFTTLENKHLYEAADAVIGPAAAGDLKKLAASLYGTLRTFDEKEVDIIYGEVVPEEGLGSAIMNRLLKAAGHRVIEQ